MSNSVKKLVEEDWPPPFTYLSKLALNSSNQWAFSCGNFAGKELQSLAGMEELTSVTELNISNNNLSSLKELSGAPGIRTLNMDDNIVNEMEGLSDVVALRSLSAKNNRITSTAGLPPNVASVDYSGNPVAELAGLDGLAALKSLELSGGKLTALAGLSAPALEQLNVQNNQITSTEGVEGVAAIISIQASGNKIADLTGFGEAHEALKELDLSDNSIKSFDDLAPLVALPALKVLKLSGNPVCSLPCYKPRVVAMFAGLKQLDDADVTQEEIAEATEWWAAEEARLAAEAEAAEAAAE